MDYKDNVKLIDFGLANSFALEKNLRTSCGSPCFAAPEIINGIKYNPTKVDMWSLGVTLYCMLCGSLPFDDDSKKELYRKIRSGQYYIPDYLSPLSLDILKQTINIEPNQRPSAQELMSHLFFGKLTRPSNITTRHSDIDGEAIFVAADMLKLPPEVIKTMILNGDLCKQTTVYYLLRRKAERGDIDLLGERKKIEKERKIEQEKQEKKEQKYRRVLEESILDKSSKGAILSKIRNLTSRRGTEGEKSKIDFTFESRTPVVKLDEVLFNNRTERIREKTPLLSMAPSRLGSSRVVKHQRASSLAQAKGNSITLSLKRDEFQRESSTGSGKGYLLRRVQPKTVRGKLREGFNPSQNIGSLNQSTLNNSGGLEPLKKKTTSLPRKQSFLFNDYNVSHQSPVNQERSLSNNLADTFKIIPKNKATVHEDSSKGRQAAFSKLIQAIVPRKINISIGGVHRPSLKDRDTVL